MVSKTSFLNSGVYRLFGTPFGIKITPSIRHYIILSNKWGAVHLRWLRRCLGLFYSGLFRRRWELDPEDNAAGGVVDAIGLLQQLHIAPDDGKAQAQLPACPATRLLAAVEPVKQMGHLLRADGLA